MRSLSSAPLGRGFIVLCLLLLVLIASQPSLAQSPLPPPNLRQHPAPPPSVDQEQFLPYWTTETGWHSELQLRNNLPSSDLTVTPALRAPDGTESALAPVIVKPQEIATVDLETTVMGSAPQYVGTYGSLVLRYRSSSAGTLFAMLMIRNTAHSAAFHIDGRGDSQDFQMGSREGIWWLPNDSATDYLILVNQGRNPLPLDLSLFDAIGKSSSRRLILAPGATNRVSVRQLVIAAGLAGSFGGIKVSAAAHAGSLNTVHMLFDEKAEFSATLKMFDYDPKAQIKERDYAGTGVWTLRAPMLALSNPDPAVAFPVGTTLRPQLFIRNVTAKPVDAALRFNWRGDDTTGKATGPTIHLSPFETRRIDVAALQDGKTLPQNAHWASVILTTNALPDELVAVAASYDQSLHYGAQTPFSDQLAFRWEGSMWEFDPYHDSIIAVGNGGAKPTQAALTIFYNQGTEKYELEQTLQPEEQMWIDVGKLIREHMPDKNGKTLPPDLTSGSYEIRDLTNKGIGALFEGKVVYDKTYGHVTYGCVRCCGYTALNLDYSPLFLPVGSGAPNGVQADYQCTGGYTWEDVSNSFYNNWSTANHIVATVDSTGYHTGMAVGITTSSTWGNLQSFNLQYNCPIQPRNIGGGDNVFGITGVAPATYVIGTNGPMTISGFGFSGKGTPTVQFTGGGISAINATVSNDTTILATYAVSCSAAPAQSVVVTFGSFEGGRSTNAWPVAVALPAAPTPTIQFAGNNVSGTTNVVVGQQIPLTASVSLPSCMTLASQSWSVPPGTAVGGYVNAAGTGIPDTTGGQVKALPPNSTTDPLSLGYTYYWASSGPSFDMTYQYTMSGGFGSVNSPVATANFNVAGPTFGNPPVSTPLGQVVINPGSVLQFGGPNSNPTDGISFTANVTPPTGFSNTFVWVQLIKGDTFTFTLASGTQDVCNPNSLGLDNTYPYSPTTGNNVKDSPPVTLDSHDTKTSRNFSAQMFVMWRPGLTGDIPVPLGSVSWGFFADAAQGSTWTVQSDSSVTTPVLQTGPSYPSWTSTYLNGGPTTCH